MSLHGKKVILHDMSLRDGMHPKRHQISLDQMIAVAAALDAAGLAGADSAIDPAELAGCASGCGASYAALLAIAVAARRIRSGEARHVLVAQAGGASADCAVVLARAEAAHAS